MVDRVFLSVLNMSLTTSYVILAICAVRFFLKKAPKTISYMLWGVVGFRLIFPFSFESIFSLIPFKATPIPQDIVYQAAPRIDSGMVVIDNIVSGSFPAAKPYASINPIQVYLAIGATIWITGIIAMLIYSFITICLLKRRLRGAVLAYANIYEADNLKTPFVIGFFRPHIYIPAGLTGEERHYIVLHEQTHIRRFDHIIKMAAYFILCVHWFNPLVWVAFLLMGADMEMSCDERVIKELGEDIKNAYSLSLVRVAADRKILNGSPLAFGEGGMKERVKNVLNFKKPSRVIIIPAVALVAVLSVGFAVSRTEKLDHEVREWINYYLNEQMPWGHSLELELPEYPETVFRWTPYEVTAIDSDGEKTLFTGMPIWNVYLADLTGDGMREFCATVSIGSGVIDDRIIVYDYVVGKTYDLNDRFYYDYALYLDNGRLMVKQTRHPNPQNEALAVGELAIIGGELTAIGIDRTRPELDPKETTTPSVIETRPTVTLYGFDFNIDNGDADEVEKHFTQRLQPEADTGWTILPDTIFIDVQIPDGTVAAQTYYAEAGTEATAHIMLDSRYSSPQISSSTDSDNPRGSIWRAADYFPGGFLGHIWAVTIDADGVERYSDVIKVIYEPVEATPPDDDISDISQRVENGLRIIMSSPLTSSNPQDYINEHWIEYENLTMKYPDGVLKYLLSQFEAGNSDGLRGHIMMRMCKEMLGVRNNVTDESLSPQEWYKQLSIVNEIELPDFKPEAPDDEYAGLIYSTVIQHYSQLTDGFTVAAPTVYGVYEEGGKLKIFVTVHVERYRLYDKTLESVGGSVPPVAMIFSKDNTGDWVLEEYLEVGSGNLPDGAYFGDSIKKLCVMPVSGKEIQGLAEKMNTDYSNDARRELLMQNLKEHLIAYGQNGVSLKKPGGEMIPLT